MKFTPLTQNDKAILVQAAINQYGGRHGKIDWSNFDMKTIKKFDIDNAEGYYGVYDHPTRGKIMILVHEGSSDKDEKKDWKTNFDREHHPYGRDNDDIRVHKGFYNYYNNLVRDICRNAAIEAYEKNIPFMVTGHSLGAGISTVCFDDVRHMFEKEMKVDDAEVYGYGASGPRVFNKIGARVFDLHARGRFYREYLGNDTVTDVPPVWMGYRHTNKDTSRRYDDVWTVLCTPIFKPLSLFGLLPSATIWDHYPQRLLKAIRKTI